MTKLLMLLTLINIFALSTYAEMDDDYSDSAPETMENQEMVPTEGSSTDSQWYQNQNGSSSTESMDSAPMNDDSAEIDSSDSEE